jgi:hypothetical protein
MIFDILSCIHDKNVDQIKIISCYKLFVAFVLDTNKYLLIHFLKSGYIK